MIFQRQHPRSRGRALLTLLVGLVVTLGLLFWASGLSAPRVGGPARHQVQAADAPAGSPLETASLGRPEREADPAAGRPPRFEKEYEGRGRLVVTVDVPPGVEFPPQWALVLDRARFLEGEEHAVPRRVEFGPEDHEVELRGELPTVEVELDDVPFGGYGVWVDAVDMDSSRQEVVLFGVQGRPDLPGRRSAHLTVRLRPAGFVDGSVVDEELGGPVEGCPVRLLDVLGGETLEARSSAAGVFVFPSVRQGRYRLEAGEAEDPLVVRDVVFEGQELTLDPIVVPRMSSVRFLVTDELNALVPNVLIEGYGKAGAEISVRTDLYGEARVPFLPAGEYRVRLVHPTGRRGKVDFHLEGGEVDRLVEAVVRQ